MTDLCLSTALEGWLNRQGLVKLTRVVFEHTSVLDYDIGAEAEENACDDPELPEHD